jgi:hypothetical protein
MGETSETMCQNELFPFFSWLFQVFVMVTEI